MRIAGAGAAWYADDSERGEKDERRGYIVAETALTVLVLHRCYSRKPLRASHRVKYDKPRLQDVN